MSVSVSIPQTVQIRRHRFVGLLGGVAAVAAAATWAVLAFGTDIGGGQAQPNVPTKPAILPLPIPSSGYLDGAHLSFTTDSVGVPPSVQHRRKVRSIMDLTPGDVAGGAVWGYAIPSGQKGPTTAEVFASMSPEARRYVESLMGLTFRELAAGAAGAP